MKPLLTKFTENYQCKYEVVPDMDFDGLAYGVVQYEPCKCCLSWVSKEWIFGIETDSAETALEHFKNLMEQEQ